MSIETKTPDLARTYTPAEFEALPEFDKRFELVEGKLVEKPMAGDEHGRIIQRINRRITLFDPEEKLGQVWGSDTSFDVGTGWMPMPDLGFVKAGRIPPESKKSVKAVPDLVVEVQSPSDLRSQPEREAAIQKIADWRAVGVGLIWAVYPDRRIIEVYRSGQPAPLELNIGQELEGETLIPGFSLPLAEIFKA